MTKPRTVQDFLQDIVNYSTDAMEFVGDMDFATFALGPVLKLSP
jgi:uncharacterized protein with HEPN domain